MALIDQYPKSAAVNKLSSVTPPTPEPKAQGPKAKGFDRNEYQQRYMRRARAAGKYRPKA